MSIPGVLVKFVLGQNILPFILPSILALLLLLTIFYSEGAQYL